MQNDIPRLSLSKLPVSIVTVLIFLGRQNWLPQREFSVAGSLIVVMNIGLLDPNCGRRLQVTSNEQVKEPVEITEIAVATIGAMRIANVSIALGLFSVVGQ